MSDWTGSHKTEPCVDKEGIQKKTDNRHLQWIGDSQTKQRCKKYHKKKKNYQWLSEPTAITELTNLPATGVIGDVQYIYSSTVPLQMSADMVGRDNFPENFSIPNQMSFRIEDVGINTISFSPPMKNPVVAFASIGNGGVSVPITFSAPVTILFGINVNQNSPEQITGTEGYAIVQFTGTFATITFDMWVAENWSDIAFGRKLW